MFDAPSEPDAPPAPDAPWLDAPPLPLDAPWIATDARRADAPFVATDAGPCTSGDYALEGTPIALERISLAYPSTTGWLEVWREADGAWAVHRVADDLESVTTLGTLEGTPLVVDGFTYEPRPTAAVDVAMGATLMVFVPYSTLVDHVLVAVYGLDGSRRTALTRIDIDVEGPIVAAWTGSGYTMVFVPAGFGGFGRRQREMTRVDLDAAAVVIGRADAPLPPDGPVISVDAASLSYANDAASGAWVGVGTSTFTFHAVSMAPDGALTLGSTAGGDTGFAIATHSPFAEHFWVAGWPWLLPGPPRLFRVDALGGAGPVHLDDGAQVVAMAAEDASTVGLLTFRPSATGVTGTYEFIRVRMTGVVQRVALSDGPFGGAFLRFLGDRYAVGWGVLLDELRRCP